MQTSNFALEGILHVILKTTVDSEEISPQKIPKCINKLPGKLLLNNRRPGYDVGSKRRHLVCQPVNSKLDWNDILAAIFEAKKTFNRPSNSVPLLLYLSARLTPFSRDLMFLF